MKKIIFFFLLFVSHAFSQTGWVVQSTPFSNINDVQFLNSQTGFIAGNGFGQFAITTNGGSTWTTRNAPAVQPELSLSFINENTGWLCGRKDTVGYFISRMYKTTNGGVNWIQVSVTGTWDYYAELQMLNNDSVVIFSGYNNGWSQGGSSKYTFNSGGTFSNTIGGGGYSMRFINKNTGWACSYGANDLGVMSTFVFKTINSGKDWTRVYKDTIYTGAFNMKAVTNQFFVNVNTGFICGDKGRFLKTTNGGTNWTDLSISSTFLFSALYFFDENTGYATASGYNAADISALKRTTDGGLTWTAMTNNPINKLGKIIFTDNLTGWTIGKSGTISNYTGGGLMKTISGGLTEIEPISSIIPDKFSLQQNYPNPFNPTTKINYELPISNYVSLKVYDVLGNEVETLVSKKQNAGSYSITFDAATKPSGIYFYKLVTDGFTETKKMLLVK
ncbi:hypothetical protein BH10BAC5_BH10BAC5_14970 [soil metagenome]